MQSQIKWFLIIIIIFISGLNNSYSQKQNFTTEVIVDMTQMAPAIQEKLRNFKQKVQDYLDKNKYFDDDITPVRVQMQFSFTSVDIVSLTYQAKLFVSSQRQVYNPLKNAPDKYSVTFRFLDERCEFIYNENIPFIKNDTRFDTFLSLLDYYAYMIAGYDEDSYFVKGGNKYFQKALDICNKVPPGTNGWNETGGGSKPSRVHLVQELLNARYDDFRKAYFEYMWTGLDSLYIKKTNAQRNILDALQIMGVAKKKEVKAFNIDIFFDSKATEIAEAFIDYGDRSVYDKLSSIDPSHQAVYQEAKNRAR
ncbi:MAG: DUF4835 family protein [Bacteroidota bacterium]|nr:DUF4835 family protein [Bacteroidota bacterium]